MTLEINPCDMQDRLNLYMAMVQEINNYYWKINEFTFSDPPIVYAKIANKYAKVLKEDANGGQTMIHSFVNMENGDILKGTWNAPVKNGVRGNIFSDDIGASVVTEHGPMYLKPGRKARK